MARRFAVRRAGGLLTAVLLIAGCTAPSDEGTNGTTTDLTKVTVTDSGKGEPKVDVHAPFAVTKTGRRVLTNGTGRLVTPGLRVTMKFLGVNGTDNRKFDSSYGMSDRTFTLDRKQTLPGLVAGLTGVTVGSRVLIALPPGDAYGTLGNPVAGIGPTDTLVLVVDVLDAEKVLTRASGKTVAPKPGLPKVTLNRKTGQPSISIPKTAPPTNLVVQDLIQGTGPVVKPGQTITYHYSGAIWRLGTVVDSTWTANSPAYNVLGEGQLLAAWDQGLPGKRVGSQVMLIVPPDKGFGAAGKPEKGIRGTDTMVFVVDILDSADNVRKP